MPSHNEKLRRLSESLRNEVSSRRGSSFGLANRFSNLKLEL